MPINITDSQARTAEPKTVMVVGAGQRGQVGTPTSVRWLY